MRMRAPFLAGIAALIAGAALLVQATAAAPGTIRGRIELAEPPGDIARRPGISDLGMGHSHGVTADQRRSVVYLETAPRGAFEDRGDLRAVMDQRNEAFVPHVLAILAGTTVEFLNSDRTYHNVFSLSRLRPFDLGRYPAGRSRTVRFDRPGIVRVFCDIHSHMSAYILVFGHRFFAVTDPQGRFQIEQVPPGTYTVAVWHEALPGQTRRVRVPEGGGEVELNVTLGPRR